MCELEAVRRVQALDARPPGWRGPRHVERRLDGETCRSRRPSAPGAAPARGQRIKSRGEGWPRRPGTRPGAGDIPGAHCRTARSIALVRVARTPRRRGRARSAVPSGRARSARTRPGPPPHRLRARAAGRRWPPRRARRRAPALAPGTGRRRGSPASVTALTAPPLELIASIASSQRAGSPIRIALATVSGCATGLPSTSGAARRPGTRACAALPASRPLPVGGDVAPVADGSTAHRARRPAPRRSRTPAVFRRSMRKSLTELTSEIGWRATSSRTAPAPGRSCRAGRRRAPRA